jgi:carbonic anhydrase
MSSHDRASFLLAAGGAAVGVTLTGAGAASAASSKKRPTTPAQAIARLKKGNNRYVRGYHEIIDSIEERRRDSAGGQKPYAIILTCADSRVPPELIFDEGLGQLFVCRVAGNIIDPHIIGSIEYSILNFHSLVVVVLGHQHCGAVKDTIKLVEAHKKAPGSIQSIVEAIGPVVKANPRHGLGDEAYVDKIMKANARLVAKSITQRSTIVRNAISQGKLEVIPADYHLESGKVEYIH